MLSTKRSIAVLAAGFIFCGFSTGQTAPPIRYLSYDDARQVIIESGDAAPLELQSITGAANASSIWDSWKVKADRSIRGRLAQGDEDSIINLLLFGTSFTTQPRLTEAQISTVATNKESANAMVAMAFLLNRVDDFVAALGRTKNNERLSLARSHLIKKLRVRVDSAAGKKTVSDYLIASFRRVLDESAGFASLVEQAKNNREDLFVARSQMFARRGLSSDTSLKPNFAIENALAQLKQKRLVTSVTRVAIIGPGLDFTDKDEGYDFYPPQTIQPFAVIESLLKMGLANKKSLQIDTYDLSPKVNSHIARFAAMAQQRKDYMINLPLSTNRKWSSGFEAYWQNFGTLLGNSTPSAAAAIPDVQLRTVTVKREFLRHIRAFDTNIVLQRPDLAEKDRYDIVIGTNIFLYYGAFEQGLAMRNLNRMLKDGGLLLSNNALVEFPFTPIRSVGYSPTVYSDRKGDADAIVWYVKRGN